MFRGFSPLISLVFTSSDNGSTYKYGSRGFALMRYYILAPFVLGVGIVHLQEHMVSLESCGRFGPLAWRGQ